MSDRQLITNTRLRVLQQCERLHHYQYQLGYRPIGRSRPLEFGDFGHHALEEWFKCWKSGHSDQALESALAWIEANVDDDFERARLTVLITGYDVRWAPMMVHLRVLDVEREFRYPAQDFDLGGKMDVILEVTEPFQGLQRGDVGIGEHKFTSYDLSPASDYWSGLRLEPQVSQYVRGCRALGHAPKFTLWDAVKRPEIKALQATPEDKREYCKTGKRKGLLKANMREHDETPEEHGQRLAGMIAESPYKWYARQVVVRLPSELQEFDDDTMRLAERAMHTGHAAKNPDACREYGRACAFLPVCSGMGSLDDVSKYEQSYDFHPELKEVA